MNYLARIARRPPAVPLAPSPLRRGQRRSGAPLSAGTFVINLTQRHHRPATFPGHPLATSLGAAAMPPAPFPEALGPPRMETNPPAYSGRLPPARAPKGREHGHPCPPPAGVPVLSRRAPCPQLKSKRFAPPASRRELGRPPPGRRRGPMRASRTGSRAVRECRQPLERI